MPCESCSNIQEDKCWLSWSAGFYTEKTPGFNRDTSYFSEQNPIRGF